MVKDIFLGGSSSSPASLTNVNGTLYFSANNGTVGAELWKSDGTAAGTELVKDINPGAAGSGLRDFLATDLGLFFRATAPTLGYELWTTQSSA